MNELNVFHLLYISTYAYKQLNCLDNESINVNTGALKILKAYHLKCVFQHNFSFFHFLF